MPDIPLWAIAATPLLLGILLLWLTGRNLKKRRLKRAGAECTCGLGALFLGLAATAAIANVYTYQRFTHETPVATVSISQNADGAYLAELRSPEQEVREFILKGDEWQLDARVLKWHGLANLLGADAHFRLERLGTRYRNVDDDLSKPRSVYNLRDNDEEFGLNVWALAKKYRQWFGEDNAVDAIYGSAVYLPIAKNAYYEVTLSQTGLVARAANAEAQLAVEQW